MSCSRCDLLRSRFKPKYAEQTNQKRVEDTDEDQNQSEVQAQIPKGLTVKGLGIEKMRLSKHL